MTDGPYCMDLGAMRSFIRAWIDVDQEDLPDGLLDPLLDEAASRIADAGPRWPWLRDSWTVTVGPDSTQGVPITSGAAVGEVLVVRPADPTTNAITAYTFVDHDTALRTYWSGEASNWSLATVAGQPTLFLWPLPSVSTTLVLDGFRAMRTAWTAGGSGAEPDCPAEFHDLIRTYGLSGAYLQQDDGENAGIWMQKFETGLASRLAAVMRAPAAPPLVLNGAPSAAPSRPPSVWRFE